MVDLLMDKTPKCHGEVTWACTVGTPSHLSVGFTCLNVCRAHHIIVQTDAAAMYVCVQ